MTVIRIASRTFIRSSITCPASRNSSQIPASFRSVPFSSLAKKSAKLTINAKQTLRTTIQGRVGIHPFKRNLATDTAKTGKETTKKSKTPGDVFLDNLGTIFLSAIGLLILTLIRSSYGTSNKTNLRKRIEVETALDPFEMDDLRTANDQISPEIFREIYMSLRRKHGWTLSQKVDYKLFVSGVMQVMKGMKGDEFTVQLGHLLDRVVAAAAEKNQEEEVNVLGEDGLEFRLLLVALSLTMKSSVRDRVEVLYEILQDSEMEHNDMGGEMKAPAVREKDVIKMVGYLQQTSQLVPDAQIVESDVKYPAQEYKVASPVELVHFGKEMKKDELSDDALAGGEMEWTCDDFHHLLRSRGVCAWGECYVKTKSLRQ
jgi:hypothetical protein